MQNHVKPLVILVAGGSASGKSTVVGEILNKAGLDDVIIIRHDDYYLDQKDVPFDARLQVNYDHPDSLDNALLLSHLKALLKVNPSKNQSMILSIIHVLKRQRTLYRNKSLLLKES